ncbi:hypothetical protein DITRI_Ditri20bG0050300 [Diplodiscus trichospermus]
MVILLLSLSIIDNSVQDPADAICEAFVRVVEVELAKEREKTRLMEESLRADEAALEAKERERSMLLREKDRVVAVKEAEEKLVADFLEADGRNKSFDKKAMMDAIVALRSPESCDGNGGGGFGGVHGKIKRENPEKENQLMFSKSNRLN